MMKKSLLLMMLVVFLLSFVACGGEDASTPAQGSSGGADATAPSGDDGTGSEAAFVSMTFGDITMSVPNVFSAVAENQGVYISAGPEASIVVTPAMETDLLPSEWDESLAAEILEPMYGSTYTNLELSAFEGDVNMNGNTAVYFAFYGMNADGKDRLVQVVRLFNADQTEHYIITLIHSAEDDFFTPEVGGQIINSITLGD